MINRCSARQRMRPETRLGPTASHLGRGAQCSEPVPALRGVLDCMPTSDPLQTQAARAFIAELAAGSVPSVRAFASG